MPSYVVGQRFVSEAEPELGLGCVEEIANRRVLVRFPVSDTVRQYASGSAPIKRVAFRIGDEVFRNARGVLDRVPERRAHGVKLEWPSEKISVFQRLAYEFLTDTRDTPRTDVPLDYDYREDPRAHWLIDHVRPEEIERTRVEIEELDEAIGSASLRLDALRLIWKTASPPEP